MKKACLASIATTLLTATSVYALDCATPPSCADLGYTDTVSNCSDDSIKCPFDLTKGKCIGSGATVGQIGYFVKKPNNRWLLCDGSFYHKDAYPELYTALTTYFGGGGDIFAVPPYAKGNAFLRPYESSSSQYADGCLPNIQGTITTVTQDHAPTGIFTKSSTANSKIKGGGDSDTWRWTINFDTSSYNPIYSSSCAAPSPNYFNVGTYIYAGKPGNTSLKASSAKSGCAVGYYYYTDGSCSSTYNSSKTTKGIVYSTYTSELHYIFGGSNNVRSYESALASCKRSNPNASLLSYYDYSKIPASVSGAALTAVNTSRSYWASKNSVVTCLSRTECTSTQTVAPGTYAYYYCKGIDKFQ